MINSGEFHPVPFKILNYNEMKNILLILTLGILAMSCDDFLTQDPIDQLGESSFYTTDDEIDMAVIAAYNGLQSTLEYEWMVTETRSDNARIYTPNTTSNTSKEVISMDELVVETTHSINEIYWEANYHNIANCNTVLDNIEVVSDSALYNQLKGEAQFIRAYHYFNLVRLYGPLFLVTERIGIDEANSKERSSVDEAYDLILEDLLDAVDLLPESYNEDEKGRVTVWAAKTLLAKVYLTLEDYESAETLLLDVEENSGHSLLSSYEDVFDISNELNDEIIFAVTYLKGGYGLGSPFANFFAAVNIPESYISYSGDGYNCPTYSLYSAYESNDSRRDVTLANSYINEAGNIKYQNYVLKYLSDVTTEYDAENDWPVLRFADVYLMLAEIKLELEGIDAALPYLNYTRERAGLVAYTTDDITNVLDCQFAIEDERRLEFALENHRFFDLVRTDRFITVMDEHFENEMIYNSSGELVSAYTDDSYEIYISDRTVDEWQLLLPIPYSVLSVDTEASQNPGY
jgi:hypothetical protein